MFEYKDASYYTSYFQNHPDFVVLEEFKLSSEQEEKNLYIGSVQVKGTVHPLVLRVEIPCTFPHHKLIFRTKSLSGYPHLIHTGKLEYGDWFCLNTPFAETAEDQLNQEVMRLKEWIDIQMSPNLPPIIKDQRLQKSLQMANAYQWERLDELKEFSSKAVLTFVGDFAGDATYFKEHLGHFSCVKTPDNRFYALQESLPFANYKFPYVIVDRYPDPEMLRDFSKLREYYGWDDATCHSLFPNLRTDQDWELKDGFSFEGIKLEKEEALQKLAEVRQELSKEIPYLPDGDLTLLVLKKPAPFLRVLPRHKELIVQKLDEIEESIRKNKGKYRRSVLENVPSWDSPEYEEYCAEQEFYIENAQYKFHYFALGIQTEGDVDWYLVYSNNASIKTEQVHYNLGVQVVSLSRIASFRSDYIKTQTVDESMFFGRGRLCDSFCHKRIALVGLGAVGSLVAESLAHSGISKIGLWDSDVVEPGNICRSAFSLTDLGESKVEAVAQKIRAINPFIKTENLRSAGVWYRYDPNNISYEKGSFYDQINYKSQAESVLEIKDYDCIFDCTGSNEMLHFLSYAVSDKEVVSLCITNRAKELLCVTNADGNPFELRKAYLSRIEQDTKNFYLEGSGCYSPTFLAKYSDVAALVNACIRKLDADLQQGHPMQSCIWSYTERGMLLECIHTFKLKGYDILLNVGQETLLDAEEMETTNEQGYLGYILGCSSADGKQVLVSHIVSNESAKEQLRDAFDTSNGILDYLGDYAYSQADNDGYTENIKNILAAKAADEDININNPLLALKRTDGSLAFYLFINGDLVPFEKV